MLLNQLSSALLTIFSAANLLALLLILGQLHRLSASLFADSLERTTTRGESVSSIYVDSAAERSPDEFAHIDQDDEREYFQEQERQRSR